MQTECPQSCEVPAFLAGELSPDALRAFEVHLHECAGCQSRLESTRLVLERLRSVPAPEVRAGAYEAILRRVHAPRYPFWQRAAAIAAAVVVMAGVALLVRPDTRLASVNHALDWLCQQQEADGSWDAAKWGGLNHFKVALSALPTLALSASNEQSAPRAAAVARSVAWLQQQQTAPGVFGPRFQGAPYNQSIATLALLRVYQRQPQQVPKATLDAALETILSRQSKEGGWGYLRSPAADPSITEWHVEVLRLASELGWTNLRERLQRAELWLKANPSSRAQEPLDSPSELLGDAGPIDPDLDFQRVYLLAERTRRSPESASNQHLERLRTVLLRSQERRGAQSGSWAPYDRWGRAGGRLYSTAMASLSLGS